MAILTLEMTSSGQKWQFQIATNMSSGQDWQIHMVY